MTGEAACIFCKIARGEIPAARVYEDERVLAFPDINPQAPLHLLIIPKAHIDSLSALAPGDDELVGHILWVAKELAAQKGVAEKGYRVVVNTGSDGGQSVYHLHFHLLAGRSLAWPPG